MKHYRWKFAVPAAGGLAPAVLAASASAPAAPTAGPCLPPGAASARSPSASTLPEVQATVSPSRGGRAR